MVTENSDKKDRPKKMFRDLANHFPINKGPTGDSAGSVRKLPQITGRGTKAVLAFVESVAKGALGNIKPTPIPGRNERFRRNLLKILDSSPVIAELGKVLKADVRVGVHESFGKPVLVSVDLLLPDPRFRLTEVRELHHQRLLQEAEAKDSADEHRRVRILHETADFDRSEAEKNFDPHRDLDPELHVDHREQQALAILLGDLLLRMVEVCWDNPELAPVSVRGRVVAVHGDPQEAPKVGQGRGPVQVSEQETLVLDMRDLGFIDEIARSSDLYAIYGSPKSDPYWRP